MDLAKLPPEVVADLAELCDAYGGRTLRAFWRMCADRPDVAEWLYPQVLWSIGDGDDIANITAICAAHRDGVTQLRLRYADGTVDVLTRGVSSN